MAQIEKISIALPHEMVVQLRQAVETGEYASSSEVVRDALRDWNQRRSLRQENIDYLRTMWRKAEESSAPHVPAEEVFARLRKHYQAPSTPTKKQVKAKK
jgi:antitoxin ParD1/3/4